MNILISGAGQLGSRYLQGLARLSAPVNIFVYDPSAKSLMTASNRYKEATLDSDIHHVVYTSSLSNMPRNIDLAILSMSSLNRAKFMSDLSDVSNVNFWLLEKVLAPSLHELESISNMANKSRGAWVNHWMRLHIGFIKIKQKIQEINLKIDSINVHGGAWGLACNATHFIDFAGWLDCSLVSAVDVGGLDNVWRPSKRPGYFEVDGVLRAEYESGLHLTMNCDRSTAPLSIQINAQSSVFNIFYMDDKILIKHNSDFFDLSDVPLQSSMTAPLVRNIISNSSCDLPSCFESVQLHKHFCRAMLRHWNLVNHVESNYLCIT